MCRAIRPMVSSSLLVVCQPRLITATRMPVARAIAIITPSTSGPGLRYFLFWLDADICSSRRCCPRPLLSSAFSCFWIMRYPLPLCPEAYHVSSLTTTPSFNVTLSSLVRDPLDIEIRAIGGDQDLGVVAAVGEDREHVARGECFALDWRSGVGKTFELCRLD